MALPVAPLTNGFRSECLKNIFGGKKKIVILRLKWFRPGVVKANKREPGENPGQYPLL